MQFSPALLDHENQTLTLEPSTQPCQVNLPEQFRFTDQLTVEAWIETHNDHAEMWQEIVSQWTPLSEFGTFEIYDAGRIAGLDTTGFFGAVFDGQYIYFVPQHNLTNRHGNVLRFNTHGDFKDVQSWEAYDAGNTSGLNTKGYYGAVFDGRFVYFVPRLDENGFHTRVLRYDAQGAFTDAQSWVAHDTRINRSYQSAGFDGRYIYFCPGHATVLKADTDTAPASASPPVTGLNSDVYQTTHSLILRYDTQSEFTAEESWSTCDAAATGGLDTSDYDDAVFDGRFMYFMPLSTAAVLRYDTHAAFDQTSSWAAYDAAPLGFKLSVGGVFDGRYIYFVPYGETEVAVRYDTNGNFHDNESWSAYQLSDTAGLNPRGFDGGFFDGRFVYFVPFYDGENHHGCMLRYDTQGPFVEAESWQAVGAEFTEGLRTVGFNAGAFDGRFFYFAPWRDGTDGLQSIKGNGRVLRYDTLGESGTFSLRFCDYGHNGGLCAAVPGTRFLVNTKRGVLSVAANRLPDPGGHYIAATYDGKALRLFINGELINQQTGSGGLINSNILISIGQMLTGKGAFHGDIKRIRISTVARDSKWIAAQNED